MSDRPIYQKTGGLPNARVRRTPRRAAHTRAREVADSLRRRARPSGDAREESSSFDARDPTRERARRSSVRRLVWENFRARVRRVVDSAASSRAAPRRVAAMAGAKSRLFARASVRPTDDSQDFERAGGGAGVSATPSFRATSGEWKRKAWKSAGERVMQSRRETKGAPTSIADVVRRAKVESSVQAARRLLQAARDKTKKAVAAKGSRNVVFNSGYVYFLVLESSWLFTVALSLSAYVMSILFCWAISAPLDGLRDTAEELGVDVSDESPALLSLKRRVARHHRRTRLRGAHGRRRALRLSPLHARGRGGERVRVRGCGGEVPIAAEGPRVVHASGDESSRRDADAHVSRSVTCGVTRCIIPSFGARC